MPAPANQPDFKPETASEPAIDPAVEELNRIVAQAESLLQSLGDQGGEAADAVRHRVGETLNQARARLAVATSEAETIAASLADRADHYVHRNPWQAIAIAALLGSVVTFLFARSSRREANRSDVE